LDWEKLAGQSVDVHKTRYASTIGDSFISLHVVSNCDVSGMWTVYTVV
jgi:hypothetical protein